MQLTESYIFCKIKSPEITKFGIFRRHYHKIRTQKAVTKAWGGMSGASTHSVIISKLARFSCKALSRLLSPPRTIPVPAMSVISTFFEISNFCTAEKSIRIFPDICPAGRSHWLYCAACAIRQRVFCQLRHGFCCCGTPQRL